ncbi:MAG: Asp-tRNA(Asn)/Glu-tRNA(Gln) amidotransferase subunit GatC [Clostridiales bacterium]|jgi:aspartyl/glutamyl-tRNA(Asn/Gln) amidotransferase C subunit|nr:Asp-tRNA(Asn)/Glu-tRNA(Gln) amidotransferase subunit GatC [Clostridiales bacterium]
MKRKEFNQLCELARLYLTPSEEEDIAQDMEEIVAFAQEVCKANIPDGAQREKEEKPAPLREDERRQCADREEILRNTPQSKDGFFMLPGKR